MALLGIQYAAFRGNASDAFLYMSFAQSVSEVGWNTLWAGSQLTVANLANVTRLAQEAPTSLLTARFLARPMPINHMVTMAVLADLVHIAVYRFYYAYHVICYVAAAPVLMAIGYRLRLNRTLVVLAGMAAVLGFWARLVLEMDASYEYSRPCRW